VGKPTFDGRLEDPATRGGTFKHAIVVCSAARLESKPAFVG
jgi:hypothetical protein